MSNAWMVWEMEEFVYIIKNTHPFLVTQFRVDSVGFALLGEQCFSRTYWANIESNATENWVNFGFDVLSRSECFDVLGLRDGAVDSDTTPGTGFRVKIGDLR